MGECSLPGTIHGLPPELKIGDRVSLVCPSSPITSELLDSACSLIRKWGLEPVMSEQVRHSVAYLAGSDEERAQSLIDALEDTSTSAVLCLRGGYGCSRLLPLLEPRLGPHNVGRKRFFGFSDITALHILIRKVVPECITFHSPMVGTQLFLDGPDSSHVALFKAMFDKDLHNACPPFNGRCLQMGHAESTGGILRGPLVGGNLSIIASLCGTEYHENLTGTILFLEDVNEDAYRIDRMITQLKLCNFGSGNLNSIVALVLGDFDKLLSSIPLEGVELKGKTLEEWFWLEQLNLPEDLPVLSGLEIGHIESNQVLPLGSLVQIDLNQGVLSVA